MNLETPGHEHSADRVLLLMAARLRWLAASLAVGFFVVLSSYWYFQIVRSEHYWELAENNRLRVVRLEAARGLIYDRSGRVLVENVPTFRLLIDRSLSTDLDASLAFAADILERDANELEDSLQRYRDVPRDVPVLVAEELELNQVARFEVAGDISEHPEFEIAAARRRLYRYGDQMAHLLGYLSEPTAAEQERDPTLVAGDMIGRSGVEQLRDRELRGTAGERTVVVDSRGRVAASGDVDRTDARAGESVTLTIDLGLQQEAQKLLDGKVGSIVALDPRDGAVRAMVSSPSFDPNGFAGRLNQEDWERIVGAPNKPLQNRAIHNAYPPGSVFKIAMAVAALADGLIDPKEEVYCGGSTRLYDRRWRCWQARGHGRLDLRGALQHSCDIYFYRQGRKMGIERIARYARMLGLGRRTGIEFPAEREGLVPDPEWSLTSRGLPWYPGETISVAIGQGPVLTSPLQIAVMTAAVANGGFLVQPHVLEGGARPPEPTGVDADVITFVTEALANVVADGTGRAASTPIVQVAGKTGTAQVIAQATWTRSEVLPFEHADHAWFTSYAPVEAPELVVVVFLEHGGRGSEAAAPLARRMVETYFGSPAQT
ncbi:MAG: penicillin-binding protein 2 [Acidobacteria bacterium]|nr:penicillin-binding protein 2 [Acidobacteriota bacterium]